MITRTVTTSKVNAKIFNRETEQVEEKVYDLPGKLNEKDAEKALNKKAGFVLLGIMSITYDTKLTAMSDEEWLEHCHEIPARGKKTEA